MQTLNVLKISPLIFWLLCIGPAHAMPTDGSVVGGSASINTVSNTMTIKQTTQNAVINWQKFGLSTHETVNFIQPDRSSIILNRVLGSEASSIFGKINSNGQVFLVNTNGIFFGKGAEVNVGGLVASTLDINPFDFIAGKRIFSGGSGSVENFGTLNAHNGGYIALLGSTISNQGTISAHLGTVALAAGDTINIDFAGDKLISLQINEGVLNSLIENGGLIKTEGGTAVMTAKSVDGLLNGVVNNTGIIQARSIYNDKGIIKLRGDVVLNTGTLDASGTQGGVIQVDGRSILEAGTVTVSGTDTSGGVVSLTADSAVIQAENSVINADGQNQAGEITLQSGVSSYLSGRLSANGNSGGKISITAPKLALASVNISTDGVTNAGSIFIGGGIQGRDSTISNAKTTSVNAYSTLSSKGLHGKIIVWSDEKTDYYGSATTGDSGFIEISGKQHLSYGGVADAGVGGNLLLDPTNIVIDAIAPSSFYLDLANPTLASYNYHGSICVPLSNGNIVVGSYSDNFGGTEAGAVYTYNGTTGALISSLFGSKASDRVGIGGITALSNGNYVIASPNWNNGLYTNAGAVTWGSGTSGVSGVVSTTNSLVGDHSSDMIGTDVTALGNGNYVVRSPEWSNGVSNRVGAVTWGNGTSGTSGIISAANSLVGSKSNDLVGNNSITELSNNNYVVRSTTWDNGSISNAGAVTWGNGTSGTSGVISAANSLVGSKLSDLVGTSVISLSNGNYVVRSTNWDNGSILNAGAVTWGNGTFGTSGIVSVANSLIGDSSNDLLGSSVTALSNGNYVVALPNWDNGVISNVGAVTWGSGASGTSGIISTINSLVGNNANDMVGSGVTALSNGNYIVRSPSWDNGLNSSAGAVTWGNGSSGIIGNVSTANSLVGTKSSDRIGVQVIALPNGNFVVTSPYWSNGGSTEAGAVTWVSGVSGLIGQISSSNSVVGTRTGDMVGIGGVQILSNGNYLIRSERWSNGLNTEAGAVTWGNGISGITGVVSAANSIVGTQVADNVGLHIETLSNGHYLVLSPNWDNGINIDAGAVTWGNGMLGTMGEVSVTNSIVGSNANDNVGDSVTELSNSNYVISSPSWDSGVNTDVGAATWGSGISGIVGEVSATNSIVGSNTNDNVGNSVTALSNGNYVVASPNWDNGSIMNVGAVIHGNGSLGTSGIISSENSIVGTNTDDQVGKGVKALDNGNYIIQNPDMDSGSLIDTGSVWLVSDSLNVTSLVNASTGTTTLSPLALGNTALAGSTVTLQASNDINVNSAINIAGKLNLVAGNAITLNAGITSTANGDAIQLSGLKFNNNVGATALTTPNGRWLVWSTTPANDTRNGLGYAFKQYSANYGTTPVLGNGNGYLYSEAPVITVGLIGSVDKVYDGTTNAVLTDPNYTFSGAIDGDSVIVNTPISGTYDTKDHVTNSGSKMVYAHGLSISGSTNGLLPVYGYQLASSTISNAIGTITPKSLSMSGLSVPASKMYDATTNATVLGVGILAPSEASGSGNFADGRAYTGDFVNLTGTPIGTYNSKDIATASRVYYSGLSLAGADSHNYFLNIQEPSSATISVSPLSVVNDLSAIYETLSVPSVVLASDGFLGSQALSTVSEFNNSTLLKQEFLTNEPFSKVFTYKKINIGDINENCLLSNCIETSSRGLKY